MPPLELGLLNGWIFTACLVLRHPAMRLINKEVWQKVGAPARMPLSSRERCLALLATAAKWCVFAYSVFLPLKVGTMWFRVGLPIALAGAAIYTVVWVNFATTPIDEPVTKGLYRYSRHPMRVVPLLTLVGVSLATSSWLLILLSLAFAALSCAAAPPDERFWLAKYGPAYREYLDRTPRWLGIPR